MLYHSPDNRWPIFGCKDYDTYLERYLVKGLFHAKVPEDIIKEYETVEYLMAHAWYHYPMYDEAMSKFLRAFEIAVKLKCRQLSIPIDFINKKGERQSKILAELITKIDVKEPGKQQNLFLQHTREIRNLFMHPDHNSYMGGMLYNKVIFTINIINTLFGDENYFVNLRQRKETIKNLVSPFKQKILGYNTGEITSNNAARHILLHGIVVGDVFIKDDDEFALLFLDAAVKLSPAQMEEKIYPKSMILEIKNLRIEDGVLYGIETKTEKEISISEVTDDFLVQQAVDFKNYLLGIETGGFNPYLTNRLHEQGKEIQYFKYRYYHHIE